jgi:electron transport complex protein RnfG
VTTQTRIATPEPTPLRLVLTLSLAGLLSGLIIVGIFETTLPTITAYQAEQLRLAVFEVLPGTRRLQRLVYREGELMPSEETGDDVEYVYAGYDGDDRLLGYAIPGAGPGFQDTIKLLYGYRPALGQVSGMRILESRETPGLGDKIYKDRTFVDGFRALAVTPEIQAVKPGRGGAPHQIDAITGATISSKAVVRIINQANERWLSRLPAGES